MADSDDTTKLIIFGLGIGLIGLFAILLYREVIQSRTVQTQALGIQQEYALKEIEQKLEKLSSTLDNFSKINSVKHLSEKSEPKTVSMNSLTTSPLTPTGLPPTPLGIVAAKAVSQMPPAQQHKFIRDTFGMQ